ncbi:Hypothetical predicted protein [Olea europaea subsp. europaea]|uniref:Uncharacterized protein n=1 Tax=Olea europaea subsp. europaea TaxID=158383 RepID=A0A8S0QJP5_OLEEU|nr:Hypothetical predicted protein [Olea europaea subsp. europaea]
MESTNNNKSWNVSHLLVATLLATKLILALIMPRSKKRRQSFWSVLGGLLRFLKEPELQREELNEEFFSHLKGELGKLRFAVLKTQEMEDRLTELEALQKALQQRNRFCQTP